MGQYILRYKPAGAKPERDLQHIRETSGVDILEESPRMLVVESNEEKIQHLSEKLSDWLVTPKVEISVPDTRYRIKRPIEE